jgi:putative NIF3 family GTP cyclohydrolase 1 type 2
MHQPDGIRTGLLKVLGWRQADGVESPRILDIPPIRLDELAATLKVKLGIDMVRVIGKPEMVCRRVSLDPGAISGRWQIDRLAREGVDASICGEINEWETCEYARDAVLQGRHKALIVLGHANSEEAGMKWLVEWLSPLVPGVPITHVPAGDPFRFV